MPRLRNILIFAGIAAVMIFIYIYLFKPGASDQSNLVSTQSATGLPLVTPDASGNIPANTPLLARDFLTLLSNVQNIKLDTSLFSDPAFASLRDSTIVLTPDGTEGRPNPFAPFGYDIGPPLPPNTSGTTTGGN